MKYCPRCKELFTPGGERCPLCRKATIDDPAPSSPVRIITAKGIDLEQVTAALDEAGLPYSSEREKYDAAIRSVVPMSATLNNIYVRLCDYSAAQEALEGLSVKDERAEAVLSSQEQQRLEEEKPAEEEEMSPRKALIIRIVSGLAFLLILALVVFATDNIIALVMKLLGMG